MIERYSRKVMRDVWTEENKFNAYLEVEILSCEAWSKLGVIPAEDVEKIRANAKFEVKRIQEIEEQTRHDVVAFTRAVSESLGDERKWVHYGLTSTDVVDTANGYLIKQADAILLKDLEDFLAVLKKRALEFKDTPCIGRTHGIHADITSFGLKWALWYEEMKRNIERFKYASAGVEAGKMSGAVGNFANIPPFIQDYVCEKLGTHPADISTQVLQRDRHAFYIATLAVIASTLEQMAFEIRNLQRTEVREAEEAFRKGQKGSSAMPHKRNPISSENICGCARVMRGYMSASCENVALWHERDIFLRECRPVARAGHFPLLHRAHHPAGRHGAARLHADPLQGHPGEPHGLSRADDQEHLVHQRRHLRPARDERPDRQGPFPRGGLRHRPAHRDEGLVGGTQLSGPPARRRQGDGIPLRGGAQRLLHAGILLQERRLHLQARRHPVAARA